MVNKFKESFMERDPWIDITTSYTAKDNEKLRVDTLAGTVQITLPISPIDNSEIRITCNNTIGNSLQVLPNGNTISYKTQLIVDPNNIELTDKSVNILLIYDLTNTTWVLHELNNNVITEDITINVPADFTYIEDAQEFLNDKTWPLDVTVTVQVADGTYTPSTNEIAGGSITLNASGNCNLIGTTTIEKSISSFVSATGSTGDWDVVLTLNNVTDLFIGQFANIYDLVGTGDPESVGGCLEITNIAGSNVTVNSLHKDAVFPTLTLTNGVFKVHKTRFDNLALFIGDSLYCENFILTSNNNTYFGIHGARNVYNHGVNITINNIGFAGNFVYPLICQDGSTVRVMSGVCITGVTYGLIGYDGGTIRGFPTVTGCIYGVFSKASSSVSSAGADRRIAGNTTDFYSRSGAVLYTENYADRTYSPAFNVVGNGNAIITTF